MVVKKHKEIQPYETYKQKEKRDKDKVAKLYLKEIRKDTKGMI